MYLPLPSALSQHLVLSIVSSGPQKGFVRYACVHRNLPAILPIHDQSPSHHHGDAIVKHPLDMMLTTLSTPTLPRFPPPLPLHLSGPAQPNFLLSPCRPRNTVLTASQGFPPFTNHNHLAVYLICLLIDIPATSHNTGCQKLISRKLPV